MSVLWYSGIFINFDLYGKVVSRSMVSFRYLGRFQSGRSEKL